MRKIVQVSLIFAVITMAQSDDRYTHIAFGSCLHQEHPMPIMTTIKKQDPDLFISLGDFIYTKFEDGLEIETSRAYSRQRANMRGLGWDIPTLAIWDDGDYGINDGDRTYPYKSKSKELFLDFWGVPEDDPRRNQEGLYFESLISSDDGSKVIQVLVLDVRSFKSPWRKSNGKDPVVRYLPDDDPVKTMLGEKQWRWLIHSVKENVDLRIIVSPLQFLAAGHYWESWSMFPRERMKLLKWIQKTNRVSPTIVISGDRHRGAFYKKDFKNGPDLFELTSSALNRPAIERDEPGPLRRNKLYVQENYGWIEADWKRSRLKMQLRGLEGEIIYQEMFSLR